MLFAGLPTPWATVAGAQIAPATATNTSAADGQRNPNKTGPALTGERHPPYRLHKSDVVDVKFTFSPEFDQTATVQPDGGKRALRHCLLPQLFHSPMGERNGMRIVRLPTIRSKHLETFVHTFFSTVHACFSDYEIVHYHTLGPALFSYLPRLFGKKTVVTVQGLDWRRKKWNWFARQVLKLGEWASARLPNQTVVVSCTLREHYRAQHAKETVHAQRNANPKAVPRTVSEETRTRSRSVRALSRPFLAREKL